MGRLLYGFGATLLLVALSGCGAQSKPMNSVNLSARTLGEKASEICAALKRTSLGVDVSRLDAAKCQEAGLAAFDLAKSTIADRMQFGSRRTTEGSDELLNMSSRVELWLNTSVVGLLQKFSETLEARRNLTDITPHESQEGGSGADLVQAKFSVTKPISFDKSSLTFQLEARLQLSGAVTVDNTLFVAGKIFPTGVGIALDSRGDAAANQSLLKRMHGFLLVIPHANDIYVDAFLEADVHSFGIDSVMDRLIRKAMGSSLGSVAKLIPRFGA